MPARVKFRLGSIFDEPCDLLVMPLDTGGVVWPDVEQEIRKAGIPLPTTTTRGISQVTVHNAWWKAVVYAAPESGPTWSSITVEELGREVGQLATSQKYASVSAPLLTARGDLAPDVTAAALMRGFMSTAPDGTLLVISIRDPDKLEALARTFPHAVGKHIQVPPATGPLATLHERTNIKDWLVPHPAPSWPRTADAPPTPAAEPGKASGVSAPTPPPATSRPRSTISTPTTRKGVFISYSHKDAKWLERLRPHLPQFEDETLIWSDKDIHPGADWRGEIQKKLATVKVAVLLVSAQFLASRFIINDELPPLLDAANKEGVIIIPVHISASRFDLKPELSRFQSANDPRTPLMRFRGHKLEEELDRIGRTVEAALQR
jgi:hypothetical protein